MIYSKIIKNKAISLVEVIVFMVIISSMAAALMNMINFFTITSSVKITKSRMESINSALKSYVAIHNKLPCPALIDIDISDVNYGQSSDCSDLSSLITSDSNGEDVVHGAVPFKTLGLTEQYFYDVWGGKILYVVPQRLTLTKNVDSIFSYKPKDTIDGAIKIKNISNDNVVKKDVISYLLLSHGRKMIGSYTANNAHIKCSYDDGFNGLDIKNCNGDSNFQYADFNYNKSAYFDDVMIWTTTKEIYSYVQSVSSSYDISNISGNRLIYAEDIFQGNNSNGLKNGLYVQLLITHSSHHIPNLVWNFVEIIDNKIKIKNQLANGDRIITARNEFFIMISDQLFYDIGGDNEIVVLNNVYRSTPLLTSEYGVHLMKSDSVSSTMLISTGRSASKSDWAFFISDNQTVSDYFAFNTTEQKIAIVNISDGFNFMKPKLFSW